MGVKYDSNQIIVVETDSSLSILAKISAMLRVFKSNQSNMNRIYDTTIGLDIAMNVFHYTELNRNGTVTGSGNLKRNKVLSHFIGLKSRKW